MATYEISNGHVWFTVTGGYREIDISNKTSIPVTGSDVTFIIELGMIIYISCDILVIIIMFTGITSDVYSL